MKKLSLNLDQLAIESFQLEGADGPAGTVEANQDAEAAFAITGWSWLCGSCDATCDGGATCPLSCAGAAPTGCNSRYCQNQVLSEINGGNCKAELAGEANGFEAQGWA